MNIQIAERHFLNGLLPWRPGWLLPVRFTAVIDDEQVIDYQLELDLALVDGEAVCVAARFVQRDGGPPITPRAIRRVPLAQYVRAAAGAAAVSAADLTRIGHVDETAAAFAATRGGYRRHYTDMFLREVAKVYRGALEAGSGAPRKAVQEWQGVSTQTAARWIAEARRRGILGPTRPGKAGEEPEL
jgi:hypothetical protein